MVEVLFRHEDFYVVLKPHGINVHNEGSELGFHNVVKEFLNEEELFLVHRLDKVTSGLLIIARNREAASIFGDLFQNHKVEKTYLALSASRPTKKQGIVKGDLVPSRGGAYKLTRNITNPSLTRFETEMIGETRLFKLYPKTGRTHQLRVVMKSLGSPILGDKLYGGDDADRVYLHAYQLKFAYKDEEFSFDCFPRTGEKWLGLF